MLDERDAIVMEVMREVFARLPFGTKFTLSDGSVATLEKFCDPQLCDSEGSQYHERPYFGVDVTIEGGKVDHVEISAFQTGSGMVVDPAELHQAPGKWTRRQEAKGRGDVRGASPAESRQEQRKRRGSRER
jgi:hypothetical protein